MVANLASASGIFKACARPAVRLVRAAPAYCGLALQPRRGPLAAFLPAYGPKGAALLRVYNVAAALKARGWRTLVVPWRLTLAQLHRRSKWDLRGPPGYRS